MCIIFFHSKMNDDSHPFCLTLILSESVTVLTDPEMIPRVAGKREVSMCSVKGIHPEWRGIAEESEHTSASSCSMGTRDEWLLFPWRPRLTGPAL